MLVFAMLADCRGTNQRKSPKLSAAFGARSLEWVLLEAVDVTTASLEDVGPCWGLTWWLVATGSLELLWGLAVATPEHHSQKG